MSNQKHVDVSKGKERDRWVCGGFPKCTEVGKRNHFRFLEDIKGGSVGVLEAAQVGARSHTHRTQVSLYEALRVQDSGFGVKYLGFMD